MINKIVKGRNVELLARRKLEKSGWLVDKKPRAKYHSPDFFGMFDLVAIKGCETRWYQIKSNRSDFYKGRKKIKQWLKDNGFDLEAEIWLYIGRGKWREEQLAP